MPDSRVQTPAIDRIAQEGIRFTNAHTPSSVCTPTRYGLLTGRYPWRSWLKTKVVGGYSPSLIKPGQPTLPGYLKTQGYHTGGFGKWHHRHGLDTHARRSRQLANQLGGQRRRTYGQSDLGHQPQRAVQMGADRSRLRSLLGQPQQLSQVADVHRR